MTLKQYQNWTTKAKNKTYWRKYEFHPLAHAEEEGKKGIFVVAREKAIGQLKQFLPSPQATAFSLNNKSGKLFPCTTSLLKREIGCATLLLLIETGWKCEEGGRTV